jgi:hypothetical protein
MSSINKPIKVLASFAPLRENLTQSRQALSAAFGRNQIKRASVPVDAEKLNQLAA